MQRDLIVKGRSLGGSSDLTLLAPIKPGFIESLESVTYKTRIKRVLETLHGARMAAHEHHTARLLSDAIERVGAIHSVRVAVLEPEDKVLLAVTFDGSWESYIRVLWDKVGTLLDLIFCGTVDYVTAYEHTFDEWLVWARRVQVETGFFYGPAESTARDVLYQRRLERMRVRGAGGELNEIQTVQPSAAKAVERLVDPPNPLAPDDPQIVPVGAPRMVRERIRNGLQGLAGLYRLTDLHRPSTPDGDVLRRAALDLLFEFVSMRDRQLIDERLEEQKARFKRQLDWLFPDEGPALSKRAVPALPEGNFKIDPAIRRDVQGGILRSYDGITHGLVLMLAFNDAAAVSAFLSAIDASPGWLTTDNDSHEAKAGTIFRNLALTPAGLRVAGIGEDELELFPQEYRQGMAARAGLLGDVRNNHPRRWRLPNRYVGIDKGSGPEAIELDGVHAVLQLRCKAGSAPEHAALELTDAHHPLRREVHGLTIGYPGVRVLAVQPLRRRYKDFPGRPQVIVEHFCYADGDGQPEVEWTTEPPIFKRNRVHLGEIVLGHENAADVPVDLSDSLVPEAAKVRQRWLTNGSFLVMRKYRQYVSRMEKAVENTVVAVEKVMERSLQDAERKELAELVYAKLMGRYRDGTPLIPVSKGKLNLFTYDQDQTGQQCPLHAHIRLAHPRMKPGDAVRPPRLMRRSMAYGPESKPDENKADDDRGLVFMAYNASLGEQFEVVQRWLTGGNSTGSSSGQSCPIVGVPENGLPRHFRFDYQYNDTNGKAQTIIVRVPLESDGKLFEEPPVLTRLEWGMYLFTPSLSALRQLRAVAATAAAVAPAAAVPWQVSRGRRLIAAMKQVENDQGDAAALAAWKAALEDPESIDRLDSASIWAAIREDHGGVLRTPYGVLVGSRELVAQVYLDEHRRYSVCGQLKRMRRSFGEIALGLDDGPIYRELSFEVNRAIGELPEHEVFALAFKAADGKIDAIVNEAKAQSKEVSDIKFEVGFDIREVLDEVLAALCDEWFGLCDDKKGRFRKGGTDWAWHPGQPPLYPGHFTALSRYMFQANPGPMAIELGEAYGKALRGAMRLFVADHRAAGTIPKKRHGKTEAPIAKALFNHKTSGNDVDFVAPTMVGVLMGFNPTIIGAVLNVLREWQRDGRFGALRANLAGRKTHAVALAELRDAMAAAAQMRPMPQLGWRTAIEPHRLGPADANAIDVVPGEKIVLGIVSGTHQSLADGKSDGRLMFGGVRADPPAASPTHACPGYAAGIGAMLGTLTSLLSRSEALRQGVAPLTFLLEGESGFVPPVPSGRHRADAGAFRGDANQFVPQKRQGLIFAWGDSWLDFSFEEVLDLGTDLRDCLALRGYTVPEDYCKYSVWPKVNTMAANPDDFCTALDSALLSANPPIAIVLSAGGNDSTGNTLFELLVQKASGQSGGQALNLGAVKEHIARLEKNYGVVLDAIKRVRNNHLQLNPRVFVHGYDHPIPIGRGINGGDYAKKWMYDPFKKRGYRCELKPDLKVATDAMRDLIDALNEMLGKLHVAYPFVHYVDLRGTIATQWSQDPTKGWADDLHPTSDAFLLLTDKLDAAITSIVRPNSPARAPARGAKASASPRKPRQPAL